MPLRHSTTDILQLLKARVLSRRHTSSWNRIAKEASAEGAVGTVVWTPADVVLLPASCQSGLSKGSNLLA